MILAFIAVQVIAFLCIFLGNDKLAHLFHRLLEAGVVLCQWALRLDCSLFIFITHQSLYITFALNLQARVVL